MDEKGEEGVVEGWTHESAVKGLLTGAGGGGSFSPKHGKRRAFSELHTLKRVGRVRGGCMLRKNALLGGGKGGGMVRRRVDVQLRGVEEGRFRKTVRT